MNSNMVKPEKSDHLHLVYYFTVPLSILRTFHLQFTKENLVHQKMKLV